MDVRRSWLSNVSKNYNDCTVQYGIEEIAIEEKGPWK